MTGRMMTRSLPREDINAGDRRAAATTAGVILLITVGGILLWHLGPSFIGGQRVSGTSDVSAIAAFYSHPSMRFFWWLGGIAIIGIILFAVQFRRYVRTFDLDSRAGSVLDFATMTAVATAPLYALSAGLESALVQISASGVTGHSALLGVFATWDWTYNGFTYFFEAAYMGGWAFVAWRTGALPRWIALIGGLTAIGHLFNSQVLISGLPDNLTLIPTAMFLVWFVAAGVFLVRGGVGKTA